MNFYRVLYSNEYSKKNGKYGIVDITKSINEYLLKDGIPFPNDLFNDLEFVWKGSVKKQFADFQMTYFPWRLISERMYKILEKYSSQQIVYYPVKINSNEYGEKSYYIMHFLSKNDVIDKKRTGDSLLNPFVDVSKLNGVDLFVYKEFDPSTFCVSERVKDVLEQNQISGCSYQKIS